MIIYANEESRKQALKELKKVKTFRFKSPSDNSRLMGSLHSDLRLPTIIEDDGILFEIIHNNCVKTASNAGFLDYILI